MASVESPTASAPPQDSAPQDANNLGVQQSNGQSVEPQALAASSSNNVVQNTDNSVHLNSPPANNNIAEQNNDDSSANNIDQNAHEHVALSASEIFIGGLPRNITEAEVKESLDYSGNKFQLPAVVSVCRSETARELSRKDAAKASDVLNNIDIKGKKVRITLSENRCRIFIGNIPKDLSREDFLNQLSAQGDGIAQVDFLKDPDIPTRNRGFAFVVYKDHSSADRARRNLSRPSFHIGKNTITVNWADPVPEPDDDTMKEVKTLYVRSLPEGVNEQIIQEYFQRFGDVEKVVIPPTLAGQKRRDFCFIHFTKTESAHTAVESTQLPHILQGRELEVTLAKPMDKKSRDEIRSKKQARQMQRQGGAPAPPPTSSGSSYPYPPPPRASYPPPYYSPYPYSYPYPPSHNNYPSSGPSSASSTHTHAPHAPPHAPPHVPPSSHTSHAPTHAPPHVPPHAPSHTPSHPHSHAPHSSPSSHAPHAPQTPQPPQAPYSAYTHSQTPPTPSFTQPPPYGQSAPTASYNGPTNNTSGSYPYSYYPNTQGYPPYPPYYSDSQTSTQNPQHNIQNRQPDLLQHQSHQPQSFQHVQSFQAHPNPHPHMQHQAQQNHYQGKSKYPSAQSSIPRYSPY